MGKTAVQELVEQLDNATRCMQYAQNAVSTLTAGKYKNPDWSDYSPRESPPKDERYAELARNELRCRRERERAFPNGIFADPAWDIILDLFDTTERGKKASVSSICIASAVPPTTALRWIKILEVKGVILKESDPHDGRRFWLSLSDEAKINVRRYLSLQHLC